MLPFDARQFLDVFAAYNAAIWPAQVVAWVLGLGAVALVFRPMPAGGRVIAAVLAAMWLFTGVFYHLVYFARINSAAIAFGTLFLVQAGLILYTGVLRDELRFGLGQGFSSYAGVALLLYAMVAYPVVGMLAGHFYPELPMFGVTPCPVTIFTFGLLLLTVAAVPRYVMIIPLLWSLVGGTAAFLLDVPQDWPLLFSGPVVAGWMVWRDRARRQHGSWSDRE